MATTALYAEIVKAERNADGDLVVVGKATGPDLDLDQQICDPAWLAKAMPVWMSTGGNLREQHSSIAAGVATELSQDGESWMVAGLIVDPVSARKVEKGVLKGYSIGVKNPRVIKDSAAPGGRVVDGTVVEVSLVDRPANPTCLLTLAKAATPGMDVAPDDLDEDRMLVKVEELTEHRPTPNDLATMLRKTADALNTEEPAERAPEVAPVEPSDPPATPAGVGDAPAEDGPAEAKGSVLDGEDLVKRIVAELAKQQFAPAARDAPADSGEAMKDGGFPVKTVAGLKNAIRAIGRAKDPAAAKKHIRIRAMALKRPDLIPDSWKTASPDLAKADDADGMTHDPADIEAVRDGLVALIKAELDELCDGDPELSDVAELLCSLRMLMCWWEGEAAGGETTAPYTDQETSMSLTATPDTTKTVNPAQAVTVPAEVDTKTPEPTGSGDENHLAELVKNAIADATTALTEAAEERNKALVAELDTVKADLEKVLALPEPGGPVITRTATQAATARHTDELHLQAQVDTLLRKAAGATDPYLRKGYNDRAKELSAKAVA